MGYSVSWIAAKGRSRGEYLGELGLTETGRVVDRDAAKISCADLPTGWLLIYAWDLEFATPQRLRMVSANGAALGCLVEDHVMFSGIRYFEQGSERWSVIHDCEGGAEHLATSGVLPAEFAEIRDRLVKQQREDDAVGTELQTDYVFDVPVELSGVMAGFRYDQTDEEQGGLIFSELAWPRKPNLFKRLFGRR